MTDEIRTLDLCIAGIVVINPMYIFDSRFAGSHALLDADNTFLYKFSHCHCASMTNLLFFRASVGFISNWRTYIHRIDLFHTLLWFQNQIFLIHSARRFKIDSREIRDWVRLCHMSWFTLHSTRPLSKNSLSKNCHSYSA